MIVPFSDEFLLIRNGSPFLLVARAGSHFPLCIETYNGEYCQFLEADDLIVVSAPEGGAPDAASMLIELVRRHHTPLVVLPGDHPGSRRLRYVVSAGGIVTTNCSIRRGTHPEQHLICASGRLSGITLEGVDGGCRIEGLPEGATVERFGRGPDYGQSAPSGTINGTSPAGPAGRE